MRKSIDEVRRIISSSGDMLLTEKYENCRQKLRIKCGLCDYVFEINMTNYKKKKNGHCKECGIYRLKHGDVEKEILELGDKLVSKYVNTITPLLIECGSCKNIFKMSLRVYRRGSRCKDCFNTRITYRNACEYIENKGDILVGDYKNSREHVRICCGECGQEFESTFQCYKARAHGGCWGCANNKRIKYTYEDFKRHVELNGDVLISKESEYKTVESYLTIQCRTCNNEFMDSFIHYRSLVRGLCSECRYDKRKYTYDSVVQFVEERGDILLSTEYKDRFEELDFQCGLCSKEFKICFTYYQQKVEGHCRQCGLFKNESYGEKLVKAVLKRMCIRFEQEISLDETKAYAGSQRFDFFDIEKAKWAIEYDGEPHFIEIPHYSSKLEDRQERDRIKTRYCYKNNIRILRISYKSLNRMEQLITDFFNSDDPMVFSDPEMYYYLSSKKQ